MLHVPSIPTTSQVQLHRGMRCAQACLHHHVSPAADIARRSVWDIRDAVGACAVFRRSGEYDHLGVYLSEHVAFLKWTLFLYAVFTLSPGFQVMPFKVARLPLSGPLGAGWRLKFAPVLMQRLTSTPVFAIVRAPL